MGTIKDSLTISIKYDIITPPPPPKKKMLRPAQNAGKQTKTTKNTEKGQFS